MNALQGVAYAIAAVNVVVTAAKRIADAKRTYQEILDRATHFHDFLNITNATLEDLAKDRDSFPADEYQQWLNLIQTSVESCNTALSTHFSLRDKDGQLCSEVTVRKRLIIAAKDDRIRDDRDKLESLEERLHRDVSLVTTRIVQIRSRLPIGDTEHGQSSVETRAFLDENISLASRSADQHIQNREWDSAAMALIEVINRTDLRYLTYGVPFERRFQVHDDLALAYLIQDKWTAALKQVPQLHWPSSSTGGGDESLSKEESYMNFRSYQLRALIHWDRYFKTAQCRRDQQSTTVRNDRDLEQARKFGLEAFHTLEDPQQGIANYQEDARQCLHLLIRVYQALNQPFSAAVYREQLDSIITPDSAITRRMTIISIVMEQSEDAEKEQPRENPQIGHDRPSEPLFAAVRGSSMLSLKALLDSGYSSTDLDGKDGHGCPLLNHAVGSGNLEIVHFLLQNGANVNCADDKQETPLLIGVKQEDKDMVRLLIDHKADVREVEDDTEWTLLHHAVGNQSTEMTELLLELAPDLKDTPDAYGKTPLHRCAEHAGEEERWLLQADMLLKKGANVNAIDHPDDLRTPLFIVASQTYTPQRERMVELLLREHHANVDGDNLPPRASDYSCLRERLGIR